MHPALTKSVVPFVHLAEISLAVNIVVAFCCCCFAAIEVCFVILLLGIAVFVFCCCCYVCLFVWLVGCCFTVFVLRFVVMKILVVLCLA